MTMDKLELIINVTLLAVNSSAIAFTVYLITRFFKRVEEKTDNISFSLEEMKIIFDLVQLNQLTEIRDRLIEKEKFDEAKKINDIISLIKKNHIQK